jgi:TRAP-type C4-dicarboxylate transport system permease small subunit
VIKALLLRLDRGVAFVCRWTVIACFVGLFLLLSLGIVQRMIPFFKLPGYDEVIELLFAWMTFVGALALWREGVLYRVDTVERLLPRRGRVALASLIHLAMLSVALLLAIEGWEFLQMSGETTPFLQIDKIYWYAAIPVCGALMAVYSAVALWRALHDGYTGLESEAGTLG